VVVEVAAHIRNLEDLAEEDPGEGVVEGVEEKPF
jgi:hypothetical protein